MTPAERRRRHAEAERRSAARRNAGRPRGLLHDVADLGAAVGGGLGALTADIATIGKAIGDAGGAVDSMIFFASPAEALKMRGLVGPHFTNEVVGCQALSAGTLVGIAAEHIATGFDGVPQIEVATAATFGVPSVPIGCGDVSSKCAVVAVRTKCCWAILLDGSVQRVSSVTW